MKEPLNNQHDSAQEDDLAKKIKEVVSTAYGIVSDKISISDLNTDNAGTSTLHKISDTIIYF